MRTSLLCPCLLLAAFCGSLAAFPKFAATPIVITHVAVIDPGSQSVVYDRTVVVKGTRIATVADAASFREPKIARVIDAHGQYLIPGLWDMHVHTAFGNWFPGGREIILPLFVANGVTGVRDMGGDLPILLAWRKQIAAGEIVGPRMVVSGPMLDADLPDGQGLRFPSSVRVTTPASAVAAVDSLKAQGADFIKVQSVISHHAYLAAAAEAKRVGLPIVGHVPDTVRLSEVIAAGQMSVEHLMGIFEGCSTQEDKFVHGQGTMEILLSTQDPARCDALFHLLVEHQVWQVPTMVWQHGGELLDQLDWNHPPLAPYVPAYWRDVTWARFRNQMMPDLQHDPLALRQQYVAKNLQMMGAMHRAGVPFLAGTDTAPGIYVLPGFSLHDELAYFVEAGFTPMEALQTATSNPAHFLRKDDSYGSVGPGKAADLVLLRANPLDDIHNTCKISAVVANGRLFERTDLDHILEQVRQAAQNQK